jgi:hypothetical protein
LKIGVNWGNPITVRIFQKLIFVVKKSVFQTKFCTKVCSRTILAVYKLKTAVCNKNAAKISN